MSERALSLLQKTSGRSWKKRNFARAMKELDDWAKKNLSKTYIFSVTKDFQLSLGPGGAFFMDKRPGRERTVPCSDMEAVERLPAYLMYAVRDKLPGILKEVV